jgi:hypothetical protein
MDTKNLPDDGPAPVIDLDGGKLELVKKSPFKPSKSRIRFQGPDQLPFVFPL